MGGLPGWMPKLIEKINWACSTSPWFVDLADDGKVMVRGRKIVLALWPFIRELPVNIAAVRAEIPANMIAATQLLDRLGDSERHYQKLFLQQFNLAGIDFATIEHNEGTPATKNLCATMSKCCQQAGFVEGIHAIVAAELAATMYCRAAVPLYEKYFEKHSDEYEPELIESGMEWTRMHAKTYTRHAIWMKRMLNDVEGEGSEEIPPAADAILEAVFALWECPIDAHQFATSYIS